MSRYKDLPLKEVRELLKKLPLNVKIPVYYVSEESQNKIMKPPRKKKNKYTLNQLGSKIDQIADALIKLAKNVETLRQDVEILKQDVKAINARLDYNNLKKLPNQKSL